MQNGRVIAYVRRSVCIMCVQCDKVILCAGCVCSVYRNGDGDGKSNRLCQQRVMEGVKCSVIVIEG